MSALTAKELYFLLDEGGALMAFQEKNASWMSALAFSSEEKAHEFLAASGSKAAEIVALASDDTASIAQLIRTLKQRAIRNLVIDLDYKSGKCLRIEFDGDALGDAAEHQFVPEPHH